MAPGTGRVRRCGGGGGIAAGGGLFGQHDRRGRAAVRVIVILRRFACCRGRPAGFRRAGRLVRPAGRAIAWPVTASVIGRAGAGRGVRRMRSPCRAGHFGAIAVAPGRGTGLAHGVVRGLRCAT